MASSDGPAVEDVPVNRYASSTSPVEESQRGFAAAVLDWEQAATETDVPDLRERIERLTAAGIHVGVLTTGDPVVPARLLGPSPPGPGRLIVGAALSDLLDQLWEDGVGPALAVLAGDGWGTARTGVRERRCAVAPGPVVRVLDDVLRGVAVRRVPAIDPDPRWIIVERGRDVVRHRVTETLFTLAASGVATRGSVEERLGEGRPLLVAAGVYEGGGTHDGLLSGPTWTDVELVPPPAQDVRILDLRTGVLHRAEVGGDGRPVRSLRFASVERPHVLGLRLEAGLGRIREEDPPTVWRTATGRDGGGIGVLSRDAWCVDGDVQTLERVAVAESDPYAVPVRAHAGARLQAARARGFEQLLCEHRRRWARRWAAVDVRIPAAPQDELALRFALFQLWGLAGGRHDLAVGARGVSGPAYSGHVFWDADVFVLPALVAVDPASAAGMVDYRVRRLDAALRWARAHGHRGARFPWESALTGEDVTPARGFLGGEPVPIRTGALEEGITADVAWAVVRRAAWAGTDAAMGPGERRILRETARYWASRCERDADGRAHIRGVIGPDEYHESVSDNAFTNGMARWNLRAAADLAGADVEAAESAAWLALARDLVDGYDAAAGIHEQFAGYLRLRPLTMRDVGVAAPVAADVLLGRDEVAASQLVKQPDVVMLHHLVPDEAGVETRGPDLDYYVPRTTHGSSLSPAVTASVLARAGRVDEALDLLRVALTIDLEDRGGTTASGLHIGAAAGAWQALLLGFVGVDVRDGVLVLDPVLPTAWPEVEVRFRCLGSDVRVAVTGAEVAVSTTHPVRVRLRGGPVVRLAAGHPDALVRLSVRRAG